MVNILLLSTVWKNCFPIEEPIRKLPYQKPYVFTNYLQVVQPILMCPKYTSYDTYQNCTYMQSGQLPLGLTCCNQQSAQASEPFLVCSKFLPHQHCFLMRSRQFLMTSIWSPLLLLAGNLWRGWSMLIWITYMVCSTLFLEHYWILPSHGMIENEYDFDQGFNLVTGVSDTRIFNFPGILSSFWIRIWQHMCYLLVY